MKTTDNYIRKGRLLLTLICMAMLVSGCANRQTTKMIETTAYCGCGYCCSWERGSWQWLKLDFWNRYVSEGSRQGAPYNGLTADGSVPYEPQPGLFSTDSLIHPWMIPVRLVFCPWSLVPTNGTVAADTSYYPFGTRMYIPGYGWGVVEDRGGAIKGPNRIDLYFDSHNEALEWGRQTLQVTIKSP